MPWTGAVSSWSRSSASPSPAAALFVLAATPGAPIWGYYVVAFVAAGVGAMDQPARSSAVPRLVPRERLHAAIALNQLGFQTMAVAGPALGGLLLATVGVAAAFLFDAVTFGAALVALLLIAPIPPHPGAARPSLATVAEGLRFARRKRIVLSTFVIDLVAMIFGMPSALFPALALTSSGPARPASGCSRRRRRRGRWSAQRSPAGWGGSSIRGGRSSWRSRAGASRSPSSASRPASFALALLFLALAGAADVFSAVVRSAIMQLETPDEIRGRVASIHILVVTSGPRIGDAEAAAVAAVAGTQFSVVSGGILCLVGLVAVVRGFPELRRYVSPLAAVPPEAVA